MRVTDPAAGLPRRELEESRLLTHGGRILWIEGEPYAVEGAERGVVLVTRDGSPYLVTPYFCGCKDWWYRRRKVGGRCKHQRKAAEAGLLEGAIEKASAE